MIATILAKTCIKKIKILRFLSFFNVRSEIYIVILCYQNLD